MRIALAQIAPVLGDPDVNLVRHADRIGEARTAGADLVVFPELGLTGYLLQDLAADVAMTADDPRIAALAAETVGLSAIVSFVEESADHRLFVAAALIEDGRLRHVHRKLFLPTYGLFDESRFFAAGDNARAVRSRLGVGIGLSVCEDFWHLAVPQVLALDGAEILVNVSSSPGRDVRAGTETGLGTPSVWRPLLRTYAQLTTSFVVFCNRVGVDEGVSFFGGSEVVGPDGAEVFSAPLWDEGLFLVDVDLREVRRARMAAPVLREERPEWHVRELERIVAERAGISQADVARRGDEPGAAGHGDERAAARYAGEVRLAAAGDGGEPGAGEVRSAADAVDRRGWRPPAPAGAAGVAAARGDGDGLLPPPADSLDEARIR